MAQDKTFDNVEAESIESGAYGGGFELVGFVDSGEGTPYTIDTTEYRELIVFWSNVDGRGSTGGENVYLTIDGYNGSNYETTFADGTTSNTEIGHLIGDNTFSSRETAGSVKISGGGSGSSVTTIHGMGANRVHPPAMLSVLESSYNAGTNSPERVDLIDATNNNNDEIQGRFVVYGANI